MKTYKVTYLSPIIMEPLSGFPNTPKVLSLTSYVFFRTQQLLPVAYCLLPKKIVSLRLKTKTYG